MKLIKLDIEVEEIRPLADGQKYAAKIVALHVEDSSGVRKIDSQFFEFWGRTENEAYKKCLSKFSENNIF